MPQLDTSTYFSQFFWLTFFFLGFYGILVKYYLPKMSRILKIRQRKASATQGNFSELQNENLHLRTSVDDLLGHGVKSSFDLLQEKIKKTSDWMNQVVESTNQKELQSVNQKYLSTLGNLQASDLFLFHHLKSVIAPNAYVSSGLLDVASGLTKPNSLATKEKMYNFRLIENLLK